MAGEHLDKAFRELGDVDSNQQTMLTKLDSPHLRLVPCFACKTQEEIPDYTGDPHFDTVLDDVIRRHTEKHPDRWALNLLRVSVEDWENPQRKRQIHDSIWKGVGGFKPEYYDSKSTYQEDAAKCFRAHHFSVPCIDWRSDSKRIGNPSKEGWRTAVVKVHLCDFCPVKTKVQQVQFEKFGKMES